MIDNEKNAMSAFKMVEMNARPIILKKELWEYQFNLLDEDLDLKNKFEIFKEDFSREFNDSLSDLFYRKDDSRNLLIRSINSNPTYNEIASLNIDDDEVLSEYPEENLKGYVPGHVYLSIDLVAAFEQMIDYFNMFGNMKWADLVTNIAKSKILTESKMFRIGVSSKCNETRAFQKNIGLLVKELILRKPYIITLLENSGAKFHKRICDELIWDITGMEDKFIPFIGDTEISGFKVHITMYTYDFISFMHEGEEHIYTTKSFYGTNKVKYQDMLSPYINQICKFKKGKPIEDRDLNYAVSIWSKKFDLPITDIHYLSAEEKQKMTEERTKKREEKLEMEDE